MSELVMPVTVSIIATHQARIRCLLSYFIEGKIGRLQNGAVIKVTISREFISVNLIYSGEVDENKPDKEYYVTSDYIIEDTPKFKPIQFPIINEPLEYVLDPPHWMFHDYNIFHFYLIRHGQGTHNVLSGMKKKTASVLGNVDTSLTEQGENQIARAGKYFASISSNSADSILNCEYLFISDLQRTKQTLAIFLLNLHKYSSRVILTNEMIVLPCSHELNFNKNGMCDGSYGQVFAGNENKSSCINISSCDKTFTKYKIDWKPYNEFYNGTRRKPGSGKKQCRKTSIISEAMSIIMYKNPRHHLRLPRSSGGRIKKSKNTKRRKRTKRNSSSRKKRKTRKYYKKPIADKYIL